MKLLVYIVLAMIVYEIAQASLNKEHSRNEIDLKVLKQFSKLNQKIRLSDRSRLINIRAYFSKIKNFLGEISEHISLPIYHVRGGIYGRRQQWDVKYGK